MNLTVVVSGSFRKHLAEIHEAIRQFNALGVTVLSPRLSPAANPSDEFVLLESAETDDPGVLEQRHLDAITEADTLYICNPDGYIDLTVAMEIGWAGAHEAVIVTSHAITDVTIKHFVDDTLSPQQMVADLLSALGGVGGDYPA